MSAPRKPTKEDLADFKKAGRLLIALSKRGFKIYLANDTMNLMGGPTHTSDASCRMLQDNVVADITIPGAGGGDW